MYIGLPECLHTEIVLVCLCMFAEFAQPHTGPRASIHPHLVSGRELAVLMSKAHLILRSIQLKIGHDLLMQVPDCVITLSSTLKLLYSSRLPSPFLLSTLSLFHLLSLSSLLLYLPLSSYFFSHSSAFPYPFPLSPSFLSTCPSTLSFIMAGVPQAADTGLFCQSIQ